MVYATNHAANPWSEELRRDAKYLLQRLHDSNFLDVRMEIKEQLRRLEMLWFRDPKERDMDVTWYGNTVFEDELHWQLLGREAYWKRYGVDEVAITLGRLKLDGPAPSR